MKKTLCFLLLLLLMCLAASCGNSANGSGSLADQPLLAADGSELDLEELEATCLSPAGLCWGGDEGSDYWFCANNAICLYFETDEEDESIIYMHILDGVKDSAVTCQVEDGMRLVNADKEKTKVNMLFANTFNVYDVNNNLWYSRGDLQAMRNLFAGRIFADSSNITDTIRFNSDGSCLETYKGEPYDGYWEVEAVNVLGCYFPESRELYRYQVELSDSVTVLSISDDNRRLEPVK